MILHFFVRKQTWAPSNRHRLAARRSMRFGAHKLLAAYATCDFEIVQVDLVDCNLIITLATTLAVCFLVRGAYARFVANRLNLEKAAFERNSLSVVIYLK